MAFTPQAEKYNGEIGEVILGAGDGAVTVGGQKVLPFCGFEGDGGRRQIVAMEVLDVAPEEWPEALTSVLGDVLGDPVAWAKKCQDEFGAEAIALVLAGTDPNAENRSAAEAAETAKAVADAITVPLIVYGSGNTDKDAEALPAVAEAVQGKNVVLGPVKEENYKTVVATALGYKDVVAGETPIDVNMAKQLNILITQMGLAADRILIDPSTGAVGYGIEYSYTVMERLRLAALSQNDSMTQMPMICNLGKEAWRAKEAKASEQDEPAWGDTEKRGVLWEATTAITLAMSGADVLVMRHPESIRLVHTAIDGLSA